MTMQQLVARRTLTQRATVALQRTAHMPTVEALRGAVQAWLDGCPLGTRLVRRAVASLEFAGV